MQAKEKGKVLQIILKMKQDKENATLGIFGGFACAKSKLQIILCFLFVVCLQPVFFALLKIIFIYYLYL